MGYVKIKLDKECENDWQEELYHCRMLNGRHITQPELVPQDAALMPLC